MRKIDEQTAKSIVAQLGPSYLDDLPNDTRRAYEVIALGLHFLAVGRLKEGFALINGEMTGEGLEDLKDQILEAWFPLHAYWRTMLLKLAKQARLRVHLLPKALDRFAVADPILHAAIMSLADPVRNPDCLALMMHFELENEFKGGLLFDGNGFLPVKAEEVVWPSQSKG